MVFLVLGAALCGPAVASPGKRPSLPVKAAPNSVASFRCPRHPVATLDTEACQGRQLLALGRRFNALTAILWPILDATGRNEFARAHRAWLNYREAECSAWAREFVGGTEAGLVFNICELNRTRTHLKDVAAILTAYCNGKARIGPYRRCPR